GFDKPYFFDRLDTIVIHRSLIVRSAEQTVKNPWLGEPGVNLGEAWHHGPVVLSWATIEREATGKSPGRNVILHEFAHHLDGLGGDVDGMPPLASGDAEASWYAVTENEYWRLVGNSQRDEATVLDHYGAKNRAEFFAVATESFFETPHALEQRHAELYQTLQIFYQQSPATWLPESTADRRAMRRSQRNEPPPIADVTEPDDKVRLNAYRTMGPADALFTLGLDHLDDGRFGDAARVFTSLLEADPDDSESYSQRAIARFYLGKYNEALEDCDTALYLDSEDVDALCIRGEILMMRGANQEALQEFTLAVGLNPKDAGVRLHRGRAHFQLGNWRRAVADLTESILGNSERAEPYWLRGKARQELGRRKAGQADLERAQLLDPNIASDSP
ncbi:zinc-dependent peptidase, partial [Pirellulales bacterium]|nr:zinc-dependent peptidase [Pirellulales bacterium]